MCGFYDNGQKIKKGDKCKYKGETITIISATHIKENKTMDIEFVDKNNRINLINIPYKTVGYGFVIED